jgi:hypothetical protein
VDLRTKARHRHRVDVTGSAEGNERLTALAGAVLLVLFAVEGATILSLHRLLTLHFFLGMLLLGPVALKIGSTTYRFARYYTGAEAYVRKGPPAPLLRLLGPLVIITSMAVLGTGVALAFAGPDQGQWLFLHKASFVLWFAVMTIHVLAYAPRLPRLLARRGIGRAGRGLAGGGPADGGLADGGLADGGLAGSGRRWLLLAASLGIGLIVAALTLHLSARWGVSPQGLPRTHSGHG